MHGDADVGAQILRQGLTHSTWVLDPIQVRVKIQWSLGYPGSLGNAGVDERWTGIEIDSENKSK